MHKILRDRAVGTSLVSGLIIAAMAMLAADRYPLAFAAIGAAWVVVAAVSITRAAQRAG